MGLDVAVRTRKNRLSGVAGTSRTYFLNLAIKRGVPSALLLLCPTGYSTEISSRMVPSFNSMVMAFPMDLLSGSWYSVEKVSSWTQVILARRASIRGSAAAASLLRRGLVISRKGGGMGTY